TCESVAGTVLAAERHNLPVERLPASDARRRFPGFRFGDDFEIVFEPQAGYLEVENCVAAHVEARVGCGAVLRANETGVGGGAGASPCELRGESTGRPAPSSPPVPGQAPCWTNAPAAVPQRPHGANCCKSSANRSSGSAPAANSTSLRACRHFFSRLRQGSS